jgi:energy-coupling factor transporter ATP-binding protein EcfA2
MVYNKIKFLFTPELEIEFTDREKALKQVEELAAKGTRYPIVVFGPEGCGKSAWLRQVVEVLREAGYDTIYIDPLHRTFIAYSDAKDIIKKLEDASAEVIGVAEVKLATMAIDTVKELISVWKKEKVAVLVDEVFQAIGLDKAEIYVKSLLNLIEYPPRSYERMVVIVATNEGVTRRKIGRHRWASLRPMWNISRKGFEELYEKIPSPKPEFENTWKLTGGNPDVLSKLYQAEWNVNRVIAELINSKEITSSFIEKWKDWLEEAVKDPDILWRANVPDELVRELIAKNLIVYNMYDRDPWFWIDEPPLEKDLDLGIGKHIAWQTPLHREAIKRAIAQR